jgi:hypothetical protein
MIAQQRIDNALSFEDTTVCALAGVEHHHNPTGMTRRVYSCGRERLWRLAHREIC